MPALTHLEFENSKLSYIFEWKLVLSNISDKCSCNDQKVFKEKESIELLKALGLVNDIEEYQMNIQLL